MKLVSKIVLSLFILLVVAYYGSAFVMPSVTVVNKSGVALEEVEVALPSSNLDFGALENGEENTLHYSLDQSDGVYNYHFKRNSSVIFRGSCGYVTGNELHKRVVITFNENNEVVCS
ncbi:hypothetical protein LJ739_04250 [Aestuariibacter halophilus]|uniref:Uncharacterized protein n=1 Tax=Fluctibacter halophilus TaxID=226011 RepID=A0ABS8G6H7_9ALTE|nr:hypothetical protein [Aestuariibacter halophilus]MCC2615450.1 hypothetical protein [Aestuariibacter halophilus]